MNLNNISDTLVFKTLKFIKHGSIKIINYDNKIYNFGDQEKELKVNIKINKPGLTYQVIKSGIYSMGVINSFDPRLTSFDIFKYFVYIVGLF